MAMNAKQFIIDVYERHAKAVENGYDLRMEESELLEIMEEYADYLLREIDAFLSFNISPPPAQMTEMRKTIQEFTSHFPKCWKCGDTGYDGAGYNGHQKCTCV
jgi:hypothetical protein